MRDEIFTKLCSASARDTGVSTAVAPLTHLLEASQASSWQAAAFLAHAVTQVLVALVISVMRQETMALMSQSVQGAVRTVRVASPGDNLDG